jgi:NADPH:quinone reductase-like Zn-dependent oxidoreductase/ubiquinone/menaquinone biosynthesis C-methylase UbiE
MSSEAPIGTRKNNLQHFADSTPTVVARSELYGELDKLGNTYGRMFAGIDQLSMDDSHAECSMTVPDVASAMPSTYLCPHLIHPTTLDILMHSSLPLVNRKLGPGSVMPVHIEEVSISASIDNQAGRSLFASATLNSSGFRAAEADVIVHSTNQSDESSPVLSVSGMELRSLAASISDATEKPREICYELKWGTDVDFLTSKDLLIDNSLALSPEHKLRIMNQATSVYISRCLEAIHSQNLDVLEAYHELLLQWMQRHSSSAGIAHNPESESEVLDLASKQGVEGEFLTRLGPKLTDIMTAKANALHIMLEDDLLYRVYADDSSSRCYALMRQYVKHLCFKQADLSILEIGAGTAGATVSFLEAMQAEGTQPASYHFTDISAGFFDRAREKLEKWAGTVTFKTLDIERDPVQQGFQRGSYDVVLACNVLHATPSITDTLARARTLLKPGGTLLLIEVTNPQPYLNITFGTLPGWWKGADEGRVDGPFLSTSAWEKAFSDSSLSMQITAHDDVKSPVSSLMVGKAIVPITLSALPNIRLITQVDGSADVVAFAQAYATRLKADGYNVITSTWKEELESPVEINIVLDDGANPVLAGASPKTFLAVTSLLRESSKVLWISASNDDRNYNDPRKHLITGFSRTAHAENEDLRLVTVDIQRSISDDVPSVVKPLVDILRRSYGSAKSTTEREYVLKASTVLVPRVIPSETLNRVTSNDESSKITGTRTFKNTSTPLRLEIQKNSIAIQPIFVEDEAHRRPLGETEIEIDARAIGVPVDGPQSTLYEYAGEVMAIGRQVSHVNISDRVLSISPVPCASHPRVSSVLVRRIPDSMSYTTAAAIPAAFMTAYHALISISDLQPGQTILIDGITSHAGQAAVAVAAHLGAKVIGTTSTQRGLETSSQDCQLSSHHIVPREGYECTRALRNLLKHNRLDAVLAVSGSQISAEVVGLIKPFGTMVNIYTNGGASKTVLKMPPNITVSSFDLQSLLQAKPHYGPKLLREAVDMACSGLSIPTNIKVCKIQELSDCFKARKGGQETNKSVLGIEDTSQVKVFEPRRPTLRLAADATFIVAGGLGDLGKRFLRLMAKAGAKHLVTLSRRGVDPAEFAALQEELNDLGPNCQLYNLKCDVAQLSSVHSALEMIRSMRLPPVKGVVQAAVVLRDSTLDRLTKAIFDSLLVTKMHGTLNLQRVFGQDDLEFFIMLSSAVGVLGTSGQASYNAGNTVQDALAQFEEGSKCHYVSLNIGTIEGADATVGYTARIQALRRQGLIPITPDELLAFFEYTMTPELRDTGMHQLVIGFNTEPISQTTATNGMVHSPMFTHVREAAERKTEAGTGIQKMTFKDTLSELHSQEDILNFIAILIRNKLSDLVSIEAGEIDLSRSIFEFGLDSLVAIELRNWVTREFDAPLQSSEIMENQDLLALAMKVRSRSRPVKDSTETSNSENTSWSTPATPRSTSVDENNEEIIPSSLPQLPLPDLNDVLDQLLESRRVFASPEEVDETRMTAQNFENIDGPSLLEQLKETASASDTRHDSWEREVYTSRREPLQDYSTFFFGHLVDGAPIHTQTERAAIIAIAALDYKIQLESGPAQPDTLNEIVLCTKSNDWLFHTTREPHTGMDRLVRHSPNREIAVLRNGHVFQLSVPLEATFAMLEAAFAAITSAATSRVPALAALTSLDRDSWASYRETLLLKSANSDVINAVEGAAFIICLDDSASSTASERCTTFMLNDRSFSNRWLDKTVQFVVAANGVSALVGEHSKLDGLGVRQLCEATTEAIITHDPSKLATPSSSAIAVKELTFDIPSTIATRITTQQQACLEHYAPIACSTLTSPLLNKEHLLSARLPVNAIAHITILLAIRLFSQCFEPVWETVSLAPFDGGRIDWVQTVTPAVMDFFNAVPASMKALNEQTDVERQIKITDKENKGLRRLLRTAAATHTKLITRAAAGKGFVTPLYHLLGAAIKQQETQPDNSVSLPELFKTRAWLECDRHATPKRFKTDCLGSGSNFRMQEAGFLMPEEGSVFVHYEVRESEGYFVSQGRDEDVSKFAKCLRQAVEVIGAVI